MAVRSRQEDPQFFPGIHLNQHGVDVWTWLKRKGEQAE
jgi:hypothetical protein